VIDKAARTVRPKISLAMRNVLSSMPNMKKPGNGTMALSTPQAGHNKLEQG
tara:strand:- start:1048 stop:1200 length:153 start_codon:yes stop_codon:yes gene_type:complete